MLFEDKYLSSIITNDEYINRLKFLLKNPKYREFYFNRMHNITQKTLNILTLSSNKTLLDFGCGSGWLSVNLAKTDAKIYGIDISDELIKSANTRKNFSENPIFLKYDGVKIPFDNNTFDYVIAFDVIEHVKDIDLSLYEILRILKPHGKFLFTIPNKYAIYVKGHPNLKIQLIKFLKKYNINIKHDYFLDYNTILSYFELKNKLNKWGNYHKNPLIILFQPEFLVLLEKSA